MFKHHSEAELWKRSTCKQNILFRKLIPPQQFLQSLLKWFRLWWQRAVMPLYFSPQRDFFFFIVGLKYFNMKRHTFESTLGCFIMHTALHTACSSGISWHIKKNTDAFGRSIKLFQYLYSCPFSLHADSHEDEEYHHTIVLCCFYCRLFYVSGNSFPLEPVLIHPRTQTPLYQHPPVI